jgi:hypothetical protein
MIAGRYVLSTLPAPRLVVKAVDKIRKIYTNTPALTAGGTHCTEKGAGVVLCGLRIIRIMRKVYGCFPGVGWGICPCNNVFMLRIIITARIIPGYGEPRLSANSFFWG